MAKRKTTGTIISGNDVDKLVTDNMKLARFFAQKYAWKDYDEALSVSMQGLLDAATHWGGRIPFGSYASLRIKWALGKWNKSPSVKKGRDAIFIHLDAPFGEESGSKTFADVLDEACAAPNEVDKRDKENEMHELISRAKEILKTCPPRTSEIISMRFGLDNYAPHTLEEVGQKLGITCERVRQIQEDAMEKLSKRIKRNSPCSLNGGIAVSPQRRSHSPIVQPNDVIVNHKHDVARQSAGSNAQSKSNLVEDTATCHYCGNASPKKNGRFLNQYGLQQRFYCGRCRQSWSRVTTFDFFGYKLKGVYPRGVKTRQIMISLIAGYGVRGTERRTSANKATICKILKQMRQQGFVDPKCECGRPVGHRGWCSVRLAKSPKRQAFLANWNRQHYELISV